MARVQVVCDVVWRVTVQQLDDSGINIIRNERPRDFYTKHDADQCLADEGFTPTQWGGWECRYAYQIASVTRVLIELK